MADQAHIDAARRGDRGAFGVLYEELYPHVYRYAFFQTRSAPEAEDLASDAFLRALQHLRSFRGGAMELRPWVLRICRNLAIDRARRRGRAERAPAPAAPDQPDHAEGAVDRIALAGALARVTEEQRAAVVLRFVLDLPAREVARILGKSEGAVEQLQRRGLASLERELRG